MYVSVFVSSAYVVYVQGPCQLWTQGMRSWVRQVRLSTPAHAVQHLIPSVLLHRGTYRTQCLENLMPSDRGKDCFCPPSELQHNCRWSRACLLGMDWHTHLDHTL